MIEIRFKITYLNFFQTPPRGKSVNETMFERDWEVYNIFFFKSNYRFIISQG